MVCFKSISDHIVLWYTYNGTAVFHVDSVICTSFDRKKFHLLAINIKFFSDCVGCGGLVNSNYNC